MITEDILELIRNLDYIPAYNITESNVLINSNGFWHAHIECLDVKTCTIKCYSIKGKNDHVYICVERPSKDMDPDMVNERILSFDDIEDLILRERLD